MKKKIRNLNFSKKISMIFVVLLVFLVSIMSVVLYRYFQETVEESVRASISNSINANENSIKSILNRMDIASDLICDSEKIYSSNTDQSVMPYIYNFIDNYEKQRDGEGVILTLQEYKIVLEFFKSYFYFLEESGSVYECIFYVDEQYAIADFLPFFRTGVLEKSDIGIYSAKEVADTAWYSRMCSAENTEFIVEQDAVNQRIIMYKPVVCNYVYINNGYTIKSEKLGALYISFDMAWLSKSIAYNNITERSEVFIVDDNFDILYADEKRDGLIGSQPELKEQLKNIASSVAETITYNGEQCVIQYNHLTENISMVTIVPTRDIKNLVSRTISVILTMTVVIIVCGIFIIFMIMEYIIRPVRKLSEHMETGEMVPISCEEIGEDEIGKLYKGFNFLMDRINQLIQDVYLQSEEKRKVELRALQSQINPHFVYNTLDTVCGLSLLRGDGDIADILTSLSQIMRYNTKRPEELVPLSKEIEIIHKYETIQLACYEDGVTFIYHLQEEAMSILVPKLIIQPLIENAILHGMDLKTRQGVVTVISRRLGNGLVVDVIDNGTNAPIEKMNRMLQEQSLSEKSDSLGIRNVHERLKRVYPEDGQLIFLKSEQGNTIARIMIRNGFEQNKDGMVEN